MASHIDGPIKVSLMGPHDCLNRAALTEFVTLPGLPESLRKLAETRLSTGTVESWARRIETPQ